MGLLGRWIERRNVKRKLAFGRKSIQELSILPNTDRAFFNAIAKNLTDQMNELTWQRGSQEPDAYVRGVHSRLRALSPDKLFDGLCVT
jgi:hypothetical protein